MRRVVFMDHETGNKGQRTIQKSVKRAIDKERYEWETIRISSKTGEVEAP